MDAADGRAEGGIASMTIEIHEQALWLIPVSLAVGFMVWVLWNWWSEEHRTKERRIAGERHIQVGCIEDQPPVARHRRVINLPEQSAPSSEARAWRRRGKPILH
jgi:hypothetical protein